jgi:5'-3' exoribonuclease 1
LLPEFDHLYLDMNGIIHGCSHPAHLDVSEKISERDMMMGIMHYIDRIVTQLAKPKVSVYMAIDGVAPRAKLNQQRSRRFRAAKDMAEATASQKSTLLHDPNNSNNNQNVTDDANGGATFDSNCITPGTEFMARMSDAIKYFIRKKIKEDPLWRNLKVVFSGHEIPGEGEHKIMQHIREMKSQPDYQPNTRHCMYGQDADLIMLGLVSHEPHFTLLREIVEFGMGFGNKNALKAVKKFTKESDFQLLHLSILREYLDLEFGYNLTPEQKEETGYDLERIVDDFVFMTFLVGNDFLPHLPSLDIGDGAFDLLFNTYREQRPTWGKGHYLTYLGDVCDPARLEAFIAVVGAAETDILTKREGDEVQYRKKKRNWDKRDGVKSQVLTEQQVVEQESSKHGDFLSMVETVVKKHKDTGATLVDGWSPPQLTVDKKGNTVSEKDFKGRYYYEKLFMTPIDVDKHLALRKSYIEGLIWCLAYYYKGCISWGWFFPYHYGPMLSDLTNLPKLMSSIHFDMGDPLLPFEQLMGCLPPDSAALVPVPYRKLMTSPESPIRAFYPADFEIDMNGKKNPWEGVNLLPFIDVQLLKDTIAKYCPLKGLTADERSRNKIGQVFLYMHDFTATETIPSFNRELGFPDIALCHSRVQILHEPDRIDIPFLPKLVPGTIIPSPGYPSLNVVPIASMEQLETGLNCFGSASKYPNTILNLHQMPPLPNAEELAPQVLGKNVFINYPMMHEAKVVAVCDNSTEVRTVKKKKQVKRLTDREADNWETESSLMQQHYLSGSGVPGSGGVNIGDIQIRIRVKTLQGMKVSPADGSSKKVFGKEEADIPLQMALWSAPAPDPRFIERGELNLEELYPLQSRVLLTKGKYKGCMGTVLGIPEDAKPDEKLVVAKVQVIPPEPPFGLAIARSVQESYLSGADATKLLKMDGRVLGKIMGSLNVDPGRYDLGLNLRFGHDFCVTGYARKVDAASNNSKKSKGKDNNAWLVGDSVRVFGSRNAGDEDSSDFNNNGRSFWEYTPKAIRLVAAYRAQFPMLFDALAKFPNERKYDAKRLFGPNGVEMLPKVREWLNSIETAKMPRTPTSTTAMPLTAIAAVQRAAEVRLATLQQAEALQESVLKLPTEALYREGSRSATDILAIPGANNVAPQLGDRVVNLCANGVPFGVRGTVVAVHRALHGCVEVVMDEEFIGGSNLQGSCKNFRGKLVVWAHLLKVVAADSAALVDSMVPKKQLPQILKEQELPMPTLSPPRAPASASAASPGFKQILRSPQAQEADKAKPVNYANAAGGQAANAQQKEAATTPVQSWRSKTPTSSAPGVRSRTPTTDGRSKTPTKKQGAWREATRPHGNGNTGFKGANRGCENGYAAWKAYIGQPFSTNSDFAGGMAPNLAIGQNHASTGLKALLGVQNGGSAAAKESSAPGQRVATNNNDAAANLKAVLGVGSPAASAVAGILQQQPILTPQQPPPRPSAADAFMKMVISDDNNGAMPSQSQALPMNAASTGAAPPPKFNFTYVQEGQEQAVPLPHQGGGSHPNGQPQMSMGMGMGMNPYPMQQPHPNMNNMYPSPHMNGNGGFPMPPPGTMPYPMAPGPAMMPHHPMAYPMMSQPHPYASPPQQPTSNYVPREKKGGSGGGDKSKEGGSTNGKNKEGSIVPSIVASKGKK